MQRKTDESLAETLIGAGFPRYEEIVKRFMKAFMKGFTRHEPNWGPGFASATHVLPRRWGAPSCPPDTPRGPLACVRPSSSLPFPLRERAAFSLSILESASFFIIIIIRRRYFARSRPSWFFFFLSISSFFFRRSHPPRTYFIGQCFSRSKFFATASLDRRFTRERRNADVICIRENERFDRFLAWIFSFNSISLKAHVFSTTIRTIVALTSASGSIGSPQLFCSPIKFWVRERNGEVLLTLDTVQSLQ